MMGLRQAYVRHSQVRHGCSGRAVRLRVLAEEHAAEDVDVGVVL
jgi:hypothetical protein